jgi:hypothetical protein
MGDVCADQQSGQWLTKAIDNHRLKSGTRLKATDARNLLKPVNLPEVWWLERTILVWWGLVDPMVRVG